MNSGLFEQINYDKAYRANRLGAAQWVLAHPETMKELLSYCFEPEQDDISHKACWVLEFVCLDSLALLFPHLDFFFEHISEVKKDSSVRPLAHLCELLTIEYYKKSNPTMSSVFTQTHKEVMTEVCFDWLITDQKVACQARAMTSLYFLGTEFDWIHPELVTVIEQRIHDGSAGYKNRGRKTIELVQKFNSKR